MDLTQFETALAELVGRPTTLRPFVCDGSPLDCDIFIVGANPATALSQDFWAFWKPGVGMDKAAWFSAYKAERAAQPLRPAKTRRMAISSTRRNLEHLVAGAAPARCLETNVYSTSSGTTTELARADRNTAVFEFLLETIRPRVILAHGRDAAEELEAMGTSVPIREVKHLSRGWSGEDVRRLGEELRAHVRVPG